MITLLSVILMQLPNYEITVPAGEVHIDGDKIEVTEGDGTMTVKLVKNGEEDE